LSKSRLEAFSDGVIAILITIMVLELKVPDGATWEALRPLVPFFLSYVLSYFFLGIYWNNHHHLLQMVEHVNGAILWANLHLLFWLSLVPAVTGWVGEHPAEPLPTAVYGVVLFFAGVGYWILVNAIVKEQGPQSRLAMAVGNDLKGKVSVALLGAAIPLAFVHPALADAIFVAIVLIWLVPDRRIESTLKKQAGF
jgi:TMEM175 potassium channel family protein